MFTGCGVEKCSDAVWLCSRMIGAVWQLGSPLPCAYPTSYCLLPTVPPCIFRFQFSEAAAAAAVINRVVMRCQIRIMYVAIALATGTNHNQTFNRVRACHSQQFSNCCAAPHRHATPRHATLRCDGQWSKRNLFSVPRAMTACLLSPENRVNFCPMQEILNYFLDGISLDYDGMGGRMR